MSPADTLRRSSVNSLEHFWKPALVSLLVTLPIPILAESSGLDVYLENFYYDTATHTFPWRHVRWFETLAHSGLRTMLVLVATLIFVVLLISLFSPSRLRGLLPSHWESPRVLFYLLLATLTGPAIVGLLKGMTTRHCPWSLSMYGGESSYFYLWNEQFFNFVAPGRCFPGAHASAGFSLLAFVPLLQGRARWLAATGALSLGMLMGWSRMMQGAHFLSHNLWSAWLCWACVLLSYAIVRPLRPETIAPVNATPNP